MNEDDKDLLAQTLLFQMREAVLQGRTIYNLFDLLGDLGGVTEIIMIVFGAFLFPISEHSFTMDAMKKFFLARTKD